MQIFPQEIQDGLEEQIKSQASICYASVAIPSTPDKHNIKNIQALASFNDSDLYYVQSILVTSSWNKNDDIFDRKEVWAAKNTPEDKPTNLNHDENIIIGHITSNWPITDDGMLIDPDTPVDNLPDKFHILTGSVIYKAYIGEELKNRTQALIEEIENGTKYVSMECFFKGFDYGLLDKASGEYKILARSEDTSHLTKYLRAYGGLGEHENYKIGRVLRNITFSGKGYVDKPANPESIILNSFNNMNKNISNELKTIDETISEKNVFSENNGVIANNLDIINTETKQMSEEVNKIGELESILKAKETDLEQALSSLAQCEAEAAEKMKNKEEEMKKKEEEMKKMKAEFDEANESLAAYKMKEEEMMKKEKKNKRMASLLEAGVELSEAEAAIETFESVDDAAFEAMTQLLAAKMAKKDEKKAEKEVSVEKEEATEKPVVTEDVLETAEEDASAINLAVGGSDDSEESTRAALIDFVYSRLGKKLNKGE